MRILVLWRRAVKEIRNTIIDHAFCFEHYDKKNEYFYFDIMNGRYPCDYDWITENMFDAVIFHYSALVLRTKERYWGNFVHLMERVWKEYPCVKILIPQDDYSSTGNIWDFARKINATYIYTVIRKEDYPILYPQKEVPNCEIDTILTGYVSEKYISVYDRHVVRPFDVVYRGRKLTYELGKHGQMKYELAELFKHALQKTKLRYDIGNTDNDKGAILSDGWFKFLASSRTTIGCLGGSGIADITGEIHDTYFEYTQQNPNASYEMAKRDCFPNLVENLHGVASPRIFESALTKTCQILVGKDYQQILKPDIDYIVLQKDYSNLDEVIEKIMDVQYCEKIAEQCYKNVIETSKFSYAVLVERIVSDIIKRKINDKSYNKDLSYKISECCKRNNDKVYKEIGIND